MRVTKQLVKALGVVTTAVGVVTVLAPDSPIGREVRNLASRLSRDVRYFAVSTAGLRYRLAGRQPDPNVSDDILADRVRSTIGPLEKRLDIPHVHVMVDDHVAILHGDVPNVLVAVRVDDAVLRVSGIDGVESHLHIGLVPGDTRPSEGKLVKLPSAALDALIDAAEQAGATKPREAVHAVLCGFSDRVPPDERAQMFGQLADDVRALAGPPRRRGAPRSRVKTIPELVAAVTAEGGIDATHAEQITRAVLKTLHGLVPQEAHDVAATLPAELRSLWDGARPRSA